MGHGNPQPNCRARSAQAMFLACLMAVGLLAGDLSAAAAAAPAKKGSGVTYVGRVEGTDAYVAFFVAKKNAFGYVCDGEQLAHWVAGKVKKGGFALTDTSGGPAAATLVGGVLGKKVEGALILTDGTRHAFSARKAKGKAGLYRRERVIDGVNYAAGWVELPDGSFKGQVTAAGLAPGGTTTTTAPPTTSARTSPTTAPPATAPPTTVAGDGGIALGAIAPAAITSRFPNSPPPDAKVATAPGTIETGGTSTTTGGSEGGGGAAPPPDVPLFCDALQNQINNLRGQLQALLNLSRQQKTTTKDVKQQIDALSQQIIDLSSGVNAEVCPGVN